MQALVLYLNQHNASEHHVHLGERERKTKLTKQHRDKDNEKGRCSTRQYREIYEPSFVLIIVSALDVDDDEGKNSLERSRLTIFNGSNCLNCGHGFC